MYLCFGTLYPVNIKQIRWNAIMTLKTTSFPWWFLRWYSVNLQGRSRSGNDSKKRATGNYIHLPLWTLIHANHSNKNIGPLQLNIDMWTFLPFSNVDMYLDDRDESSIKRMLLRHSECKRLLSHPQFYSKVSHLPCRFLLKNFTFFYDTGFLLLREWS